MTEDSTLTVEEQFWCYMFWSYFFQWGVFSNIMMQQIGGI